MLRNVFIVLVLAALAATPAVATSTRSVKAHKYVPTPAAHHTRSAAPRSTPAPHPGKTTAASRRDTRRVPVRPVHARIVRQASEPEPQPTVRTVSLRSRQTILLPAPLKGSLESLTRQNTMAEAEGLERILDEDDLNNRIAQKLLVPVPASPSLQVSDALPVSHRYCRPWTANFVSDLDHAHAQQFHRALFVSSAVRTVEYQKQLMHTNGNAAAAEGDVVSPHLTGATVDIAKQGMDRRELGWMRSWLESLQLAGQIDVEEEFKQSCFHITVYKSYVSQPPAPKAAPRRAATGTRSTSHGA